MYWLLIFIGFHIFNVVLSLNEYSANTHDIYNKCDLIDQPICQGIHYSKTKMPNLVGISNQADAAKRMNDYYPLINAQCSHYLKLFLCTIYFPMCVQLDDVNINQNQNVESSASTTKVLQPCKKLCIYIQSKCEFYMNAFKLPWPVELNCTKFPDNTSLCIKPKNFKLDQIQSYAKNQLDFNELSKLNPNLPELFNGNKLFKKLNLTINCLPNHFKVIRPHSISSYDSCYLYCNSDFLYNKNDKHLAKIWILVWAGLGFISSFIAILTFIIDSNPRFQYPERPIVFIVLCYGGICLVKLLDVSLGRELVSCFNIDASNSVFVKNGFEGRWCTVSFLCNYYLEMCATLWWLMLAISSYLVSCRKWSWESVDRISNMLHVIAWILPGLQCTIAMITHQIEADELMISCFTGKQSSLATLLLIILPRSVYFILGVILLTMSFKSLINLRGKLGHNLLLTDSIKNQQSLDKFIAKTAIFCGVYGVPMICYILCQIYYYWNIDSWNLLNEKIGKFCSTEKSHVNWLSSSCNGRFSLPLVEIKLLEVFSSLIIGITSATWMWANRKSLMSCYVCLCGNNDTSQYTNDGESKCRVMTSDSQTFKLQAISNFDRGNINNNNIIC